MKMWKFALITHEFEQAFFETGRIVSAFCDRFLVHHNVVFGAAIGRHGVETRRYAAGALDAICGRASKRDYGHVAAVERPTVFGDAGQFDHRD